MRARTNTEGDGKRAVPIGIRLGEDMREVIARMARDDGRTFSNMVRLLLHEGLEKRGVDAPKASAA